MAYTEAEEKMEGMGSSEAPVFGSSKSARKSAAKSVDKMIVKYFIANMSDDADRLYVEDIMTRSMDCKDAPVKVGDVLVIRETENFDKEGNYNLLVKYLELVNSSSISSSNTPPPPPPPPPPPVARTDEPKPNEAEDTMEELSKQFLKDNTPQGMPNHDY